MSSGSLFKRKIKNKKGEVVCVKYYIKWYENGRPRNLSTGAESKSEANAFFREWNGQGRCKTDIPYLEEIIIDQIDTDNYSPKTIEIYKTVFNDLKLLFPGKKINTFTLADITKYKKYRKGFNEPVSVNIYLRTLRTVFNKALKHKLINIADIPPIDEIPVTEDSYNAVANTFEPKQKSYTPKQFMNLLNYIYTTPKAFKNKEYQTGLLEFCLADYYTGCRRNEILNIVLRHINIEERIIPVVQYKKRGKFRVKAVPIHPYLWNTVISKRFYDENGDKLLYNPDEKLIQLKPDFVTHKIKDINRALGYPESLKLHSIRHTYGTQLQKLNVDKFNIRDLLGHSSMATTEGYVHIDTDNLKENNSRLPELEYKKIN